MERFFHRILHATKGNATFEMSAVGHKDRSATVRLSMASSSKDIKIKDLIDFQNFRKARSESELLKGCTFEDFVLKARQTFDSANKKCLGLLVEAFQKSLDDEEGHAVTALTKVLFVMN